jgi:hypothetical protein
VKVRASVVLPVGPDEAWARLVDWEGQPEWMADAEAVQVLTASREGPGVRIAVRTRVLGFPLLTDVLEVTEWRPPQQLVVIRRGFVRGRGAWRLDRVGDHTRFVWTEELRMPVPVVGELALQLYRPLMRRLMRRSLDRLAAALR